MSDIIGVLAVLVDPCDLELYAHSQALASTHASHAALDTKHRVHQLVAGSYRCDPVSPVQHCVMSPCL